MARSKQRLAATVPSPAQMEAKRQAKIAERIAADHEKRRKEMAQADVVWDPRTAVGRRDIALVNMGANTRASVSRFNTVLFRKAERTEGRQVAWAALERLFDRVGQGDVPEPRFEPGVDTSGTPGVADAKLDAKNIDAQLRGFLDGEKPGTHRLLFTAVAGREDDFETLLSVLRSQRKASDVFGDALDRAFQFFHRGMNRPARNAA